MRLFWRMGQAKWRALGVQSRTVLSLGADGFLVSLILGGVVELALMGGDVKDVLPWVLCANTCVWVISVGVPPLLAVLVLVTRRASLWLGVAPLVLLSWAWFMAAGGVFATCQGIGEQHAVLWWAMGIVGATGVAGVLVVEWKLAPLIWKSCQQAGRLNLRRAEFRPAAPLFVEKNLPRWMKILGVGGAVGAAVGVVAGRTVTGVLGESAGMVLASFAGYVGALLAFWSAWAGGVSLLVRVLAWERRTGRKVRIPAN